MRIRIERILSTQHNTLGKLYIDYHNGANWQYFCDTLEDVEREVKIYGETAIPKGIYRCKNMFSNKFNRLMPCLQNVKGFTGILIHPGNTENDSFGCVLVGTISGTKLINSKIAFDKLWAIVKNQNQGYDIEII